MPYLGEIASLVAAFLGSSTALLFTSASHRIGSFTMSHYRMLLGTLMIYFAFVCVTRQFYPHGISAENWAWLLTSGVAGFFICDVFLFQSYVDLGPRVGSLLFSTTPIMAALLGLAFLGEKLSFTAWIGIAIALTGVAIVILEKKSTKEDHPRKKHFKKGVAFILIAAFFQAVSILTAKPALEAGVDSLAATVIRGVVGTVPYWLVSMFRGRMGVVVGRAKDRKAMWLILAGSALGPAAGVYMMMVAVKNAPVGIASTLMSLSPVMILPLMVIFYKEKITYRAVIGAIVAFLGAALLFNAR